MHLGALWFVPETFACRGQRHNELRQATGTWIPIVGRATTLERAAILTMRLVPGIAIRPYPSIALDQIECGDLVKVLGGLGAEGVAPGVPAHGG